MSEQFLSRGLMAAVVLCCLPPGAALAQSCNPGERVEYKTGAYPEKWDVGTCVRPLPGGTQVLIRQAPSQFYPEGSERAYAVGDVRPAGAAPAPARPC